MPATRSEKKDRFKKRRIYDDSYNVREKKIDLKKGGYTMTATRSEKKKIDLKKRRIYDDSCKLSLKENYK